MLSLYLEGDGMAFLGPREISPDPTPSDPTALRLALQHPVNQGPVAWLARPCHYLTPTQMQRQCHPRLWTSHRFGEAAVAAMNQALDQLKAAYPEVQSLHLYGYSGGAAVALLLAARRDDVTRVTTIAGNLDHQTWSEGEHLAPLRGSLNPVDFVDRLRSIPQWHWVGARDDVVPPYVARRYMRALNSPRAHLRIMSAFDHHCCWAEQWPRLLGEQTQSAAAAR
ncbi:hypothetical protein MAIT1_01976 [Magnetofaba australis IT-1]|uniref:Alpha/beta hydrolase n=1 Tax=Magnetofaba australis IT-1 TaxID=1434232 RepID=A0A1Y2K1J7_9PROT|nr:hypothetical protein MAIT1_01976 [Magnetofaba australis IT-1]